MKKQEYIEKYGLEKYQDHLRKVREYNQSHKKEFSEYYKQHREKRLEYQKQYSQEHPEYHKQYYYSEYQKQYRQTHREELLEYYKQYQKQYSLTPKGRAAHLLRGYRQKDKSKGFETDLTVEWIMDNIFNSKCYYCEETDWTKLGTDRIDNTKGHTMDNCICACGKCNIERKDKYTVEEFKEYKQIRPKIA